MNLILKVKTKNTFCANFFYNKMTVQKYSWVVQYLNTGLLKCITNNSQKAGFQTLEDNVVNKIKDERILT